MRSILIPLLLLLIPICFGQTVFTYAPFEIRDEIDSIHPFSGSYKRYLKDSLIETGTFKSGIMIGEWKSFALNGNLVKQIHYKNGILDSTYKTFYSTGIVKLSGTFINGVKHGDWVYNNPNGKHLWTCTYDNGKPIGCSNFYDEKGKVIKCSFNHQTQKFERKAYDYLLNQQGLCSINITDEWFFYWDPKKKDPYNAAHGLDRKSLNAELLRNNLEIPVELFNTFFQQTYLIQLTFKDYACSAIKILNKYNPEISYGTLDLYAQTNDIEILKHPETNELSLVLLEAKINEAFSCFQPWSLENGTLEFLFLFNLNDFE